MSVSRNNVNRSDVDVHIVKVSCNTLAGPGRPPPNGAQFFLFSIRFRRKAPVSDAHAPRWEILAPPAHAI